MGRLFRWAGVVVIAVVLGSGSPAVADDGPACDATPSVAVSSVYTPGDPVVLIGTGDTTTRLIVDRLPTDRYGAVTVASDSDDAFAFTVTPPLGAARPVFVADSPDSLTGALLLDQTGTWTVTVVATGSWAIVIR